MVRPPRAPGAGAFAPALVAVVALASAGCSSGAARNLGDRASSALSTTSSTAAAGTSAGGATTTTVAGGPQGGSKQAATSPAGSGTSAGGSGGPSPAAPGTYAYAQSGSFSALGSTQSLPPQGTDVVDPAGAEGAGSWSQVWHTYLDSNEPPDDTTFAISPSGIAITAEVIRMSAGSQTFTFTCTFSSPVEVIDWPPTVGHQFAGTGDCTSPGNADGSFSASVSGSVSGTQSTSIGGSPTTAYVVSTKVTTSGAVDSTSTETDWFDPGPDLDLYTTSQESGSYDGVQFSSQATRTLQSTHPS